MSLSLEISISGEKEAWQSSASCGDYFSMLELANTALCGGTRAMDILIGQIYMLGSCSS